MARIQLHRFVDLAKPVVRKDEPDSPARRNFLARAATLAAVTGMSSEAFARNFDPNAEPVRYPDPDVVVLDKRFRYKLGNTPIRRHYKGTLWAEGCAWSGVGRYLVWSDIPRNENLRWIEEDEHVSRRHRFPSGHSNGNTFDFQGRQISFCHEPARVIRYEWNGEVTVLAETFEGERFNAPNDGMVHPDDGSIWFTDPGYGALVNYEGKRYNRDPRPFRKEAIYRIDAKTGKITKVADEPFKPNGMCFSHDYKKVYVADTGLSHYADKGAKSIIWVYDVDGEKLKKPANFRFHGSGREGRVRGRHPLRRGRERLGCRGLGRRRLRRRARVRARRHTDRPHQAARDLRQSLLRRHQAQPTLHGRLAVALFGLRRDPRRPHHLRASLHAAEQRTAASGPPFR
jgi:gluconolactonase